MRLKYLAIFISICSFCLHAQESQELDPFVSSLTDTRALLPSLVSGSVSVINGDWNESETDFYLSGPEPLHLTRKYSKQHAPTPRYLPNKNRYLHCGQGWNFNHPSSLILKYPQEKDDGNSKYIEAFFRHPCGTTTSHAVILPVNIVERDTIPLILNKRHGLTNTTFKEISGKTNFNNTLLYLNLAQKNCTTITGSGETSYFDWKDYKESPYTAPFMPLYTRKSNGNYLFYKKDGLYTSNPTQKNYYNWINFKHSGDGKTLEIKASDGKWAHYEFDVHYPPKEEKHFTTPEERRKYVEKRRNLRQCYLTKAEFSHKPVQTFKYNSGHRLIYKTKGENYFLKTEYYYPGDNEVDGLGTVYVQGSKDPCKNKVKQQKAPVGQDKTPIVTHRFVYHVDNLEDKKSSGHTNVYDALLRKTSYYYNKQHRLTRQDKFTGVSKSNYQLYCSEQYIWDDEVPAAYRPFKTHQAGVDPSYVPSRRLRPKKPPANSPTKDPKKEPEKVVEESPENVKENPPLTRGFTKPVKPLEEIVQEDAKQHEAEKTTKQTPFNIEQYLVEKFQSTNPRGNLIGKCLRDASGQIQLAHFFEYDCKGNITVDQIFGNLTGSSPIPIQLDKHSKRPLSSKTEQYSKQYFYSQDHFNLLIKEVEDNGRGIEYNYQPNTSLVISKFVLDHDQIYLREFYEYDENTSLTKLIKDDGCSRDKNDLVGVTHRRITYFSPRQTQPVGLPEKIDEMYLDLSTNQEVLLKRLIHKYSNAGELLLQEHYDSQGLYCYSLEWEYDSHGNITLEKNALGHTLTKEYDANDNLIKEIGPRSNEQTVYTYDFANRLIKKEIWDGQQTLTTAYEYDYIGNQIAMVDCLGYKTEYVYDEFDRLIQTKYPETLEENGQLVSASTAIEYDIFNRPILTTDERENKTSTSYNIYGKPTCIRYADNTCEKFEYALDGSLVKSIARNGSYNVYKRDFLGRVLEQKTYSMNHEELSSEYCTYKGKLLTSKINTERCKTSYVYDGAGRLISTICEDSQKYYEYDSLGRIQSIREVIDVNNVKITEFDYDFLNHIIREKISDEQGNLLLHTRFEYDEKGNKIEIIQKTANGKSVTSTKYNLLNQPIKRTDAEGCITRISYDYNNRNGCGQRILKIIACDDLGKKKIHELDPRGRLTSVIRTNALDMLTAKQEIIYDAVGNKQVIQDFIVEDGKSKERIITRWTYNVVNEPIDLLEAVDTPEQRHTSTIYNSYGQKERVIKSDGIQLFYTYDAMGRLKNQISSDGSIQEEYQYNRNHQVTQVIDHINHTVTKRVYDIRGRMISEILANGLILNYKYDALDRMIYLQLPDHSGVQYVYDSLYLREVNRIKDGKIVYTHRYEKHDRSGNLISEQAIGMVGKVERSYDLCKRPISIVATSVNADLIWSQSIPNYDRLGRITHYTIKDGNKQKEYKFNYNDLDSLCGETGSFDHSYQVDSLHNRKSVDGKSYKLNALHQVIKTDNCQYEYDAGGNLIKKIDGLFVTEYAYDALNRLTSVVQDGMKTKYRYDAFYRRMSKSQNGKVWKYLYQGENEIGCIDETGQLIEFRALGVGIGAEIGAAISVELENRVLAPIHDHNGNVCCLVDALNGQKVESYSYSAFGEEKIFDGEGNEKQESINPWRYASKRFDVETGLVYFGRRYYDSKIGKWITPDPSHFDDGPNLYAYLHHSPLMHHDAYGLAGEAYRDSCLVACNPHRPDKWSDRSEISCYESNRKITYRCSSFEDIFLIPGNLADFWASDEMAPVYERSQILHLNRPEYPHGMLALANGILTTLDEMIRRAEHVSDLVGGYNVHIAYNGTQGIVADGIEYVLGLYGITTESVSVLHQLLDKFDREFSKNDGFFLMSHSQGCLNSSNFSIDCRDDLRSRVFYCGIAPGGYFDEKAFTTVLNYRASSRRDFVPRIDQAGIKRARGTIIDLPSHPNASWLDHSFDSPTYESVLKQHLQNFQENKGKRI